MTLRIFSPKVINASFQLLEIEGKKEVKVLETFTVMLFLYHF